MMAEAAAVVMALCLQLLSFTVWAGHNLLGAFEDELSGRALEILGQLDVVLTYSGANAAVEKRSLPNITLIRSTSFLLSDIDFIQGGGRVFAKKQGKLVIQFKKFKLTNFEIPYINF